MVCEKRHKAGHAVDRHARFAGTLEAERVSAHTPGGRRARVNKKPIP